MTTPVPTEQPSNDVVVNVRVNEVLLRVSSSSPAQSLASAISHAVYDGKKVVLRAIGAGAVNQCCKGIAIARGYVALRGLNLLVQMGFAEVKGRHQDDLSAMVFHVVAQ